MEENEPASPGMQGSERVPPMPPPPLPAAGPAPVFVPPPPPPGKGRGWKVVALIALALLAVSLLYNLSYIAGEFVSGPSAYSASGPKLEELVVEHANVSDRVAVIKIEGIITSDSSDGFNLVDVIQAQLDRAEADSRVKAVVLKVDSPGGEVLASDDIYRAIEKFQEDSGKPVVAAMGNLAASGGYYVSAPCRWIVANEMTLTGSIGVIMHSLNYRGLMNKVGLQPFVYKSGKYKDMLSGTRDPNDVSEEERR
ncbi:MAG TPA: S49 family peptidase, partial [Clostridia bacterium]|nr:S49 family peptidase [Clostridia bacterium]